MVEDQLNRTISITDTVAPEAATFRGASDDYSRNFTAVRTKLVGRDGIRYIAFVRTLEPRYATVYRDIAIGYACLVLSVAGTEFLIEFGMSPWLMVPVGATFAGFWIAYLQLFLHEGAHYGLAASKSRSDFLANSLIAWLVGTNIATYRPIHFLHHRNLGTLNDSEFTYFFPLNLTFPFKNISGVRAIEVMLSRMKRNSADTGAGATRATLRSIVIGMAVHALIIGMVLLLGFWASALVWVMGTVIVFPFFGALRQLLEHRDDKAESKIDYSKQDHGAFTRIFKEGTFSSTFGGAGFNRHLLHHWEPQVSYTNLPELEAFLETTAIRTIMDRRRTTYGETFRRLLSVY